MTKRLFSLISLIFIISIALVGCGPKNVTIEAYVGDALRMPLQQIKATYEEQNPHVTINYTYAGSKTLGETIRTIEQGDIAIMGTSVVNGLNEDGLLISNSPLVTQVAVIAVADDSTVVTSWDDLANEGVRIALVNPELGVIGTLAKKMVDNSPNAEAIQANVTTLTADLSEIFDLINAGEIDAGIVMPSLALKTEGIATIDLPDDVSVRVDLSIGVPIYTTSEAEAQAFADFITSEAGKQIFLNTGFVATEQ